jgi:hypothetical protein
MSSLQVHGKIVFRLQLQIETQKMNVGHSYIHIHNGIYVYYFHRLVRHGLKKLLLYISLMLGYI